MNVWDLVVRIAGNGQSLRDDLDKDKVSIDELLASIHDKDMSVEANTTDAETKLDAFKQRLREIQDTHALIRVEDEKAQAEVDKLKLQLDDITYRALKITVDDPDAEAKLEDLRLKLDKLRLSYTKLPIGVEDGSALEKIQAIRMDLEELHGKTVDVNVRTNGARADAAAAAAAKGGGGGILAGIISALIPLVSPVGAAATVGAMGLASDFASTSAGALGLGLVAKGALSPVFQASSQIMQGQLAYKNASTVQQQQQALVLERQAWAGLTAEQVKSLQSLQAFKGFWQGFVGEFSKPVTNLFTNSLKVLEQLLTDSKPMISGAASAFGTLLTAASKALNSPFWKTFFVFLGGQAKQSILAFGQEIGNLGKGFAALMMAFAPATKSMSQGIVKLTKDFAGWATHLSATKGFQQFLQYAQASGTQIGKLFSTLGPILGAVLKDLAPLGMAMLKLINNIALFVKNLLTANPLFQTLIKIIVGGVTNVVEFANAIFKLLNWLSKTHPVIMQLIEGIGLATAAFFGLNAIMAANPIALVIIAIAALIAIGVELVKHWTQVRQFFVELWKWFTTETTKVWDAIAKFFVDLWKAITAAIVKAWMAIEKWFTGLWKTMTTDLTKAWSGIETFFSKLWNSISGTAQKVWQDIVKMLTGLWHGAIMDAENIFNGLAKFFEGLWKQAVTWGENIVHMVANGIMAGIHWVENAVTTVANKIKSFLGFGSPTEEGPGATSDQWAPNLMRMLTQGVKAGSPALQAALNQALSLPPFMVSPGVANMMQSGGLHVTHTMQGTVQHELHGQFDIRKFGPQAIKYIQQQIYQQTYRQMRT